MRVGLYISEHLNVTRDHSVFDHTREENRSTNLLSISNDGDVYNKSRGRAVTNIFSFNNFLSRNYIELKRRTL